MISDVGSTTDFFMKPEVRPKAEPASSEAKPSVLDAPAQKRSTSKSEFASKLKDVDKPKRSAHEKDSLEETDRFSKSSPDPKIEPSIQKRAPASEKPLPEIDTMSDNETAPLSMKGRLAKQAPENAAPKAKVSAGDEEVESTSIEDSNLLDLKSDPNIRLLSVVASPQFDVKDLSPSELKEVKEVLRDQQAQVKQASVQKFMTQLQNQFGITPDKVVQAFAKMDEKALTAPPSETVSQFVNNLNVKGSARNQVADLYKQMLTETGEAALNEKLLGSDDDSKSVSLKVIDSTQSKLAKLNKSIDSLNDNFFRKGEFQPQSNQQSNQQIPASIRDQLKKMTEANQEEEEEDTKAPTTLGALLSQLDNKAGALAAATAGAASSSADSAATVSANAQAPAPVMDMSAFAKPNQSQNFDQGEASQDSARGNKAYSAQNSQAGAANQGAKNFAEAVKGGAKSDNAQIKISSAAPGAVTNQTSAVSGGATNATAGTTAAALNPEKMMMNGPNKQDATENVQELIKQAQVIIKKGGGEMNVQMKPEGMGQVHLKVALENGQVSIQMMAQNDKVKKLLEDGIHELKSNLASHKLQVESLKIGIANGLQDKKMEQQQSDAQREAMRDAQREAASNFAGDMRDQRQERNSGFTDVPGWRAYRNDSKRVSVEAQPEQTSSARRRDDSRRLSLIA